MRVSVTGCWKCWLTTALLSITIPMFTTYQLLTYHIVSSIAILVGVGARGRGGATSFWGGVGECGRGRLGAQRRPRRRRWWRRLNHACGRLRRYPPLCLGVRVARATKLGFAFKTNLTRV
jgi:hypothetical protein